MIIQDQGAIVHNCPAVRYQNHLQFCIFPEPFWAGIWHATGFTFGHALGQSRLVPGGRGDLFLHPAGISWKIQYDT